MPAATSDTTRMVLADATGANAECGSGQAANKFERKERGETTDLGGSSPHRDFNLTRTPSSYTIPGLVASLVMIEVYDETKASHCR